MKIRASLLAGAVALGWGGVASAALSDGTAVGLSALVLNVWDPTDGLSYTRALGTNLTGFNPTGSYSFTADANYNTVFGAVNKANLLWNVAAYTVSGTPTALKNQIMVTQGSAPAFVTNAQTFNTATGLNKLFGIINGNATASAAFSGVTGSLGDSPSSTGFPNPWNTTVGLSANGVGSDGWGTMNAIMPGNTSAGVGQSLLFFLATSPNALATQHSVLTNFSAANAADVWTLSSGGTLTYGASAVVPEPDTLLLLGSGLLCLIGIARRRIGESA
jgi:hypothetical protein